MNTATSVKPNIKVQSKPSQKIDTSHITSSTTASNDHAATSFLSFSALAISSLCLCRRPMRPCCCPKCSQGASSSKRQSMAWPIPRSSFRHRIRNQPFASEWGQRRRPNRPNFGKQDHRHQRLPCRASLVPILQEKKRL